MLSISIEGKSHSLSFSKGATGLPMIYGHWTTNIWGSNACDILTYSDIVEPSLECSKKLSFLLIELSHTGNPSAPVLHVFFVNAA